MTPRPSLRSRALSVSLGLCLLVGLGGGLGAGLVGCKKRSEEAFRKALADELSKGSGDTKGSSKPKGPVPKTPAGVKITWKEGSPGSSPKMSIEGMKSEGELLCSKVDCSLSLHDLPEGTKVKVGDAEETASSVGSAMVTVELGEAIGAAKPIDALTYDKKIDPKAKVVVTFPDDVKIESQVPPVAVKFGLESFLEESLKNGTPVLFGKESDAAPAVHTTMNLVGGAELDSGEIMGPAKTMHEVDRVALEESSGAPRDAKKKCGGYTKLGDNGGPAIEVSLMLQDWNVKLVERKTGKVIEEKKFEAPATCPYTAQGDTATSYPDSEAVKSWLRSKR
jgi:hypothetical protein